MPVNEAIYALLGEFLFGQSVEGNVGKAIQELVDENSPEFWNKVHDELRLKAVLGITSSIAGIHKEIPKYLREK